MPRNGGRQHLFIGERYFHVRNLEYQQWFRENSQVVRGNPLASPADTGDTIAEPVVNIPTDTHDVNYREWGPA